MNKIVINNDKVLSAQKKQCSLIDPADFQFVIFTLLMFFIYAPFFFIQFGRLNDYMIIATKNKSLLGYGEAPHLLNIGRPLGAVLVSIQSVLLDSVASLAAARFVSFALCMIAAYFIFRYYVNRKLLEPLWALLAVFLLFTLPSVQLVISYVANSAPGCLTVLLSTISYMLFDKAIASNPNFPGFTRHKSNIFFLFLSFIVLSAAFYIYPANALFFLIFPLSNILFSSYKDWRKIRLTVLRDIIFFTVVGIFYYFSIKFSYLISHRIVNEMNTLYEFSIGLSLTNFAEKLAYTARVLLQTLDGFQLILLSNLGLPLLATGEPSVISPKVLFFALFFLGCLSQLVSFFRISKREEIGKNALYTFVQMTAVVLFLILFAISPLTLPIHSQAYPPALRTTIPISAMWVLIAFWSILSITKLFMNDKKAWVLPVALAFIVGTSTVKNVIVSSLNAHMELSFIRQMLSSRDLSKIKRVVLLGSELDWAQAYTRLTKPSTTLIGSGLQAEFYLLGANNSMQPMIAVVCKEMGIKNCPSSYDIMQGHWYKEEDTTEYPKYIRISDELWDKSNRPVNDESTLIINMNHARLKKLK